jgi:hypothetical protein
VLAEKISEVWALDNPDHWMYCRGWRITDPLGSFGVIDGGFSPPPAGAEIPSGQKCPGTVRHGRRQPRRPTAQVSGKIGPSSRRRLNPGPEDDGRAVIRAAVFLFWSVT